MWTHYYSIAKYKSSSKILVIQSHGQLWQRVGDKRLENRKMSRVKLKQVSRILQVEKNVFHFLSIIAYGLIVSNT